MQKFEILADTSKGKDVPGNLLTLDIDLVPANSLYADPQIGIGIVINDGQPEVPAANPDDEGEAAIPNTEIFFQVSLVEGSDIARAIKALIEQANDDKVKTLAQALEFKTAQLSCAKGEIGELEVVKVADSDRGEAIGFGFYDLIYRDDSGDNVVIHTVSQVECYVPFTEEEQYDWLRALVGGNHQYTSSIKIKLTGFDLESVRTDFAQKFADLQQHLHNHVH